MLLSSTRRVDTPASSMVRFNPVVEAIVGYRFHLIGTIFVRPSLTIGLCVTRYDVAVDQASGTAAPQVVSVLTTPRAYLSLGLETALVFR